MFLTDELMNVVEIGGKGYNLAFFKKYTNLLIPEFKCLKSDFFDLYKENKQLYEELLSELDLFLEDDKKYAVRSSGIDEDSKTSSFAGIHDSFLNVKKEDVISKIFEVYNSAFSKRAIDYRKINNLNIENIKMAVIIQEMVDADFAGVINTINPITNNPDEIVICVDRGLGEKIVDGSSDGSVYNVNGKNITLKGKDILTKKQIKKIIEFTNEIQRKTNRFQDIEFAIKDNKIYFLQTRDITTYQNINPHKRIGFIDNANIIESYYGEVSPLTYSFVKDVYRDVYTCTLRAGKVRKKIMNALAPSLSEMLYYYNNRIYYNMKSWYHVTSIFPFKKSTNYMENMMGVKSSSNDFRRVKMNIFDMLKLGFLFISKVINIEKLSNKFIDKFNNVVMPYYGKEINLTNDELKQLFYQIEREITNDFSIPIINDCAVMIFYGMLKEKINKMNIPNKEDLISKCISNNGNVESCGSSTYLEVIAEKINKNDILKNDFKTKEVDELYNKYHHENSVIYDEIMNYILKYGSRVTDELKMETVTMIENHKMIYGYLKNMVVLEKEKTIIEENNDIEIPRKLKFLSKLTKKYIRNRERLRLKRTYIYSVVRNIFLCFGRNLKNENKIKEVEDVFYLTKKELFEGIDDYQKVIEMRKKEELVSKQTPYYDRYVFYEDNKVLAISNNNTSEGLIGIPSGAGIVTGEVTIMNSNKDYLKKGNIIVTKRTDPGWISLFPITSGLVVEHGSMLSHSFVVAREMGLPAVVGVVDATEKLRNGDIITLDGIRGVVKIENK